MGASLSKLRDRTRLRTQETEEIGNPGRKNTHQTSSWDIVSAQLLVLAARGNLHHQDPSAPTSFFGNYMTFPPYNSFIQQGSLHYNLSHLLQADRHRESLQLENERLHRLLNQSHDLGIARDNVESRNRDLQRRLAQPKEHWESQKRRIKELNNKLSLQEVQVDILRPLQRQAGQAQRYKSLLTAKESELASAQRQIEEDKSAISELERLHRLGLVNRARVAHLETELSEAKTGIAVFKDELKRREDSEFYIPATYPKSIHKTKSTKTPVKAPNSPASHRAPAATPWWQSARAAAAASVAAAREVPAAPNAVEAASGFTLKRICLPVPPLQREHNLWAQQRPPCPCCCRTVSRSFSKVL
ncbi:hypothetical protein Emag_007131 [Eimeria magna]